jgi:hypothetical protein
VEPDPDFQKRFGPDFKEKMVAALAEAYRLDGR